MQTFRIFLIVFVGVLSSISPTHADEFATQSKTKQIWQLLDYLAVDYGKSVQDGNVISINEGGRDSRKIPQIVGESIPQ